MKIGLALGSGGARGYSHLGAIQVLTENNIKIDSISGASIGAWVAAYYALNLNVDKLIDFGLKFRQIDILKYTDLNNPALSIVKGNGIRKVIQEMFGDAKFEDTKIPLAISATALEDGSKVVFKEGKLSDAIFASSAIPGIFPPVVINGKHLVDGGLSDAVPIDLVQGDILIGVDLYAIETYKERDFKMRDVLERTYQIMLSKLSDYKEKEYSSNMVIIKPKYSPKVQTFSFHLCKEIMAAGELAAIQSMPQITKLLKGKTDKIVKINHERNKIHR